MNSNEVSLVCKNLAEIPLSILQLEIACLYLDNNYISQMLRLPNRLQVLSCKNNKIQSMDKVAELPYLVQLDLSFNLLNTIERVYKFKRLEVLILSNNLLEHADFSPLKSLRNLRILDISNNELNTNSNTEQLYNLPSLDQLVGNKNKFKQWIVGKSMTRLKKLALNNNCLESIHIHTNSITVLDISNNKLMNTKEIQKAKHLSELYFAYNYLNEIDESINLCKQLTIMNFSSNNIKDIPILRLPLLKKLNLSENRINSLDFAKELNELEELVISSNEIKDICTVTLLVKLKKLDIAHNSLKNIKGISELKYSLLYVDVSFNSIISEIDCLKEIQQLQSIECINTKGNPYCVTLSRDYRYKILNACGESIREIDKEGVTNDERARALKYLYDEPLSTCSRKVVGELDSKEIEKLISTTREIITRASSNSTPKFKRNETKLLFNKTMIVDKDRVCKDNDYMNRTITNQIDTLEDIKLLLYYKYINKSSSFSEHKIIEQYFKNNGYIVDKVSGVKDRSRGIRKAFEEVKDNVRLLYYAGTKGHYKDLLRKDKDLQYHNLIFGATIDAAKNYLEDPNQCCLLLALVDTKDCMMIEGEVEYEEMFKALFDSYNAVYFTAEGICVVKSTLQIYPLYIIYFH